jgi:hypothetical protein
MEDAARGAAIALALVGDDSATAERHGNHVRTSEEPAAAAVSGGRMNPDRGERPIT